MLLKELVTPAKLKQLAGPQSFARGEQYLARGAVRKLLCTGDVASATVQGTMPYQVRMWTRNDDLEFQCTCPFAMDMGAHCKHFVAVGLAMAGMPLTEPEPEPEPEPIAATATARPVRRGDAWGKLDAWLRGLDVDTLAGLLLDAARNDKDLKHTLMTLATPAAFDERTLQGLIDDSMDVPDFVGWDEADSLARRLDAMLEALLRTRTAATASALLPLLEYAFERLDRLMEQVDDSGGAVGDMLVRLGHEHAVTCAMARPDPDGLAERLFELATRPGMGLWDFGPEAYGAVLGEAGRRRYCQLVQAAWHALPGKGGTSTRASILGRMMMDLAGDDVDLKVAILSRDLDGVHRYRLIAEALQGAGRAGQAAEWARRGLKAYPDRLDDALCDLIVTFHLDAGQGEEAMALRFRQFEQWPSLAAYRALAAAAQAAGAWPVYRERAWRIITGHARTFDQGARTLHVAIALWERNLDLAREHAAAGPCAPDQLLALATALEPEWPDEAFEYYRRLVRHTMEFVYGNPNDIYAQAFVHVQRIAKLLERLDRPAERGAYLEYLRTEYRRKRNFMKLLDNL